MNANDVYKLPSDQALFSAYTEYAKMVLQTIFLMNGGGAVALLAFLGSIDPENGVAVVAPENIKLAIYYFVGGVVAGVAATAFAFATEFTRFHDTKIGSALLYGIFGFFAAVAGYGLFAYGCYMAAN